MLTTGGKKIGAFFTYHEGSSPFALRHSRKTILLALLRLWLAVFVAVLTIPVGIWLALMPFAYAIFICVIYKKFSEVWKYHGYSLVLLHVSTGVITLMFIFFTPHIHELIRLFITWVISL